MVYPAINLAADTCFASKRWSKPAEWLEFLQETGINCIEISADCDCDPLYVGTDYLEDWIKKVREEVMRRKMRVVSLYSGHSTYSTTGLAHHDPRVRKQLIDNWLLPYAKAAADLGAGLGFYMHAFTDTVLQSSELYASSANELCRTISRITAKSADLGCAFTAVEQMYTPQQIPWTIAGCAEFIRKTGAYTTLDTGHQIGQKHFYRPSDEAILDAIEKNTPLYVGSKKANAILTGSGDAEERLTKIRRDMDAHPYLFADEQDSDLYAWVREFSVYSPIIHLQQTDGSLSAHHAFTTEHNKNGIVKPELLLDAIRRSYERRPNKNLPARCKEINLTLELFFPLSATTDEMFRQMKESAAYWREAVPYDGMRL